MKIKKLSAVLLCVSALLSNIAVNARGMGVASWINRNSALTDTVTDSQNKLWVRDIEEWSDFETDGNGIIIPERVKERYRKLKEENMKLLWCLPTVMYCTEIRILQCRRLTIRNILKNGLIM